MSRLSTVRSWKRLFAVLAAPLLLGGQPILAQQVSRDFAVLTSGDTLRGFIWERTNTSIEFRPTPRGKETIYDADQVRSYAIDAVPRVAAEWVEDTIRQLTRRTFLRAYEVGHASLFGLLRSEGDPNEKLLFFLRRPDGVFLPLRGRTGWLVLNRHLIECEEPSFLQLLEVSQFSNTQPYYERVVRQYNRCVRPDEKRVQARAPFRWAVGLMGGVSFDFWIRGTAPGAQLYGDPNGPYSLGIDPRLGPQFSFILSKRATIQVEAYYARYAGRRSVNYTYSLGNATANHRVAETLITVPVTVQYVLTDRALRWYLRVGLMPLRKFKSRVWMQRSDQGVPGTENLQFETPARNNFGLVLGTGTEVKLASGRRARFELRGTLRSSDRSTAALATCPSVSLLGGIDLLGSRR